MNVQLLVLAVFTTDTVNIARSLECYKCNESWSATMCFKRSRIETCHYRPESVCMAVDASVTNLKGEKSIIFVRKCTSRAECHSSQPCRDIKLHLWKKKPGLLVEPTCRPQCCSSNYCNDPVPTPNLLKSSTRKILPTAVSPKSPKKCLKIESKSVSKSNHGNKPLATNCSTNDESDSCFVLRARVIEVNTREVLEIAEWKDCGIESRDCRAINNRCTVLQELARSLGADVENCDVRCCKQDLCNAFISATFPTFNQLEVIANRAGRTGRCEQSLQVLKVLFISFLMLRV